MNLTQQNKLESWIKEKIKEGEDRGEKMFLGVPEHWLEDPLHCCNNGHISTMYLKSSEKGCVCLNCYQPSHLFPKGATEEELLNALK